MKRRVADYIADILIQYNITQVFSVVGGGAMHLNDAFGNHKDISCIYNHHEQACTMAAEGYARWNNKMAVACVTSGPGGTNAITGVLCAWDDSIPLLVISGQVRTDTTIQSCGLKLRQLGEQEYDIVNSVRNMTKYAEMILDSSKIRYCVEKAIYLATHGRRGPCWIDIPLDIQGMSIEVEKQIPYIPEEYDMKIEKEKINDAIEVLTKASRPVILAGSGIRTAGAYDDFLSVVKNIPIPVVAATAVADLFPAEYDGYYGNFGVIGGRTGNFIVQNADCLLILGARLSLKQIGFNYENFSPNSYKIMIDIDPLELKKKTINIDLPICMDIKDFLKDQRIREMRGFKIHTGGWLQYCLELKKKFPIYQEKFKESEKVNPYYFAKRLRESVEEDAVIVVGNSCACDMVRQMGIIQEGQRLWGNTNCGTMGYDLPAALGASVASGGKVYCVTGDGSIMMNIQELQTIVHNKLPVKIFIHNNEGYEAIMNTHKNFFGRLTGCNKESGISFPDFRLLALAFGIPYHLCRSHEELDIILPQFISEEGYGICEIWSDENQMIEPKTKSKVLENGQMYSPPIDDLYPFLDDQIYKKYADFGEYMEEIS